MHQFDMSANLMSLGGLAIAVGIIVDGSVVIVENIYRHLSERKVNRLSISSPRRRKRCRAGVFRNSIISAVFLPLFTLTDVEGKMFSPLAMTVTIALACSLVVSVFIVPGTSSFILTSGREILIRRVFYRR